jgi:hypothetical protein
MSSKVLQILTLFIVILLIFFTNPHFTNILYTTFLGRLILIAILIYLSANNITLGLLFLLYLIINLNLFFREGIREGMEVDDAIIIDKTTENNLNENTTLVITKEEEKSKGIDRQTIEETIRSENSKEIPIISSNTNNIEILPNDPSVEKFSCMVSLYM